MKQQIRVVSSVKELNDGPNGEKRYTLNSGRSKFAILVMKDSDDFEADDLIGKKVIVTERTIDIKDDQGVPIKVQQWYFDNLATDEVLDGLMNEDLDFVLQQRKLANTLKVSKEYNLSFEQLTSLI